MLDVDAGIVLIASVKLAGTLAVAMAAGSTDGAALTVAVAIGADGSTGEVAAVGATGAVFASMST